jgi:hypothetical protein
VAARRAASLRIPFAEAITEPLLFKKQFDLLSVPQATALKVFYGLPLKGEELDAWAVFNENCLYDELGRVISVTPTEYVPQEYERATLCVGRRGAKTSSFSSFIVAYEALCGGHASRVRKGQTFMLLQVAQDLGTATRNLKEHIIPLLELSPIGAKELQDSSGKLAVTATQARLKGGALVTVAPPSMKIRGSAIAVCAMDELAFWPSDLDSAQPDFEVERAVVPAMTQFKYKKLVKTSTPWTKEGLMWRDYQIGTRGEKLPVYKRHPYRKFLFLHASTAAMDNPAMRDTIVDTLETERALDIDAFSREYLAQFSESISGFLNATLLRDSVAQGTHERAYDPKWVYIAALDPAFLGDAFAFTIGHYEPQGFVQDVIRHFKPSAGMPLNPAWVLEQIIPVCNSFGLSSAYTDQHELSSFAQLAAERGLFLEKVVWTKGNKANIWGSFQQLLNQKRLHLLDHPEQLQELLRLERTLTSGGGVKIAAPSNKHDDLAVVLALCSWKAQGLTPGEEGFVADTIKGKTTEEAVWAFTTPKTPHWYQ